MDPLRSAIRQFEPRIRYLKSHLSSEGVNPTIVSSGDILVSQIAHQILPVAEIQTHCTSLEARWNYFKTRIAGPVHELSPICEELIEISIKIKQSLESIFEIIFESNEDFESWLDSGSPMPEVDLSSPPPPVDISIIYPNTWKAALNLIAHVRYADGWEKGLIAALNSIDPLIYEQQSFIRLLLTVHMLQDNSIRELEWFSHVTEESEVELKSLLGDLDGPSTSKLFLQDTDLDAAQTSYFEKLVPLASSAVIGEDSSAARKIYTSLIDQLKDFILQEPIGIGRLFTFLQQTNPDLSLVMLEQVEESFKPLKYDICLKYCVVLNYRHDEAFCEALFAKIKSNETKNQTLRLLAKEFILENLPKAIDFKDRITDPFYKDQTSFFLLKIIHQSHNEGVELLGSSITNPIIQESLQLFLFQDLILSNPLEALAQTVKFKNTANQEAALLLWAERSTLCDPINAFRACLCLRDRVDRDKILEKLSVDTFGFNPAFSIKCLKALSSYRKIEKSIRKLADNYDLSGVAGLNKVRLMDFKMVRKHALLELAEEVAAIDTDASKKFIALSKK